MAPPTTLSQHLNFAMTGTSPRWPGLFIVLAMHAAILWGLWQHRLLPSPVEITTLFVNFIAPPTPEKKEETKRPLPPKPKPIEKPQPRQIIAETPIVAPSDYVAPPPLPKQTPIVEAPIAAPPMPLPIGPVRLGAELSVVCPERTPPRYPALSRRFGEEGTAVLRVELDETGRVAAARVSSTSGFARLDDAALEAVRNWRCNPAQRDGQPVRAVALQPFKFILQGS